LSDHIPFSFATEPFLAKLGMLQNGGTKLSHVFFFHLTLESGFDHVM
jgi:hypothetical protein